MVFLRFHPIGDAADKNFCFRKRCAPNQPGTGRMHGSGDNEDAARHTAALAKASPDRLRFLNGIAGLSGFQNAYDFSILLGAGINFKKNYFISLIVQKGVIKFPRFVYEQQGGSYNALSLKIVYSF